MSLRSRGRLHTAGVVLLALGSVAGCGTGTDEVDIPNANLSTTESPTSQATASASASASPSAFPSPSAQATASKSASASSTPAATPKPEPLTLRQQLLSADEMPGLNRSFTWRVESTRVRERRLFATCEKFDMTSIGALRVAVREYAPARKGGDGTAGNLVAGFPDVKTAMRAYEVLKSWRGQCAEELSRYDNRKVGKLQPVRTSQGASNWYLLTYGPVPGKPDLGYFDAQGIVRVGKTISWLELRVASQDYNYPADREPMVRAVRASASKIG